MDIESPPIGGLFYYFSNAKNTTMTDINEELFNQPNTEFSEHLNIPYNERIIFSARFGMGKTTFLKWYFEQSIVKEKYNTIHLFPVNYSVATNEDIFKYIKYDVIVELLRNGYEVKEDDVKLSKVFKQFFKKNYEKIAASIIHMIPLLGKEVIDSYDRIRPLIDTFFDIQEKIKLENNEGDRLITYLETLENSEGNIFEDDFITKIIEAVLSRAKDKNTNDEKENILIIDDLDRIDPEHIFRLLNIFAAHFDRSNNTKNKFGFDKVIFVCDINNIREIFRHKYGLNVDFNGYIDKFFSNQIFHFKHVEYYKEFAESILMNAKINVGPNNVPLYDLNFSQTIRTYLDIFISNIAFDLRNVIKWGDYSLQYKSFKLNNHSILLYEYDCVLVLKFLSEIFGDKNKLIEFISSLENKKIFIGNDIEHERNLICGDLVRLLDFSNKSLRHNNTIDYIINGENLNFQYTSGRSPYLNKIINYKDNSIQNMTDKDFLLLLNRAVRVLDENHFF